jgi:DNA-directed RNA polymerase beta subunit
MSGLVIPNYRDFDNSHSFLSEELLIPNVNKTDAGRTNMFCSHVSQEVVLNNPERPRVFTRFENEFGSYTTTIKRVPQNARVVDIFDKNPLQKVYILQYDDYSLDIHFAKPVHHLTENYGYRLSKVNLDNVNIDDIIPKDTIIQNWPFNDEDNNFCFGVNLKTMYMNMDGLTYEDAIIASESACQKKLVHTSVEEVIVVLNSNDLTTNSYGTIDNHKGFPDVNETIESGILLTRRRINHESILFDLSKNQLNNTNYNNDYPIYANGTVVDIDIYSNLSTEELDKHPYNSQLLKYHLQWLEFRDWIIDTFKDIVEDKSFKYSEDIGYWYNLCNTSVHTKWRYDKSEFDGVVLKFLIAKNNEATNGSKITNRYGGKGVICDIRPDDQMPGGVDLIINSLGVINRQNISQNYESELNFIADNVVEQMRTDVDSYEAALDLLMTFYKIVAPKFYTWIIENLSDEELEEFAEDIVSKREPIYIEQAPFFGNISFEDIKLAYETFGIEKVKIDGIEEPMIIGTNYYMKLRHEAKSKFSARSGGYASMSGLPAKNNKGVKSNTEHHSKTPIRLGEQELQNLLIANDPEELKRFLRLYATDDVSRAGMISDLLLRNNPFSDEKLEPKGTGLTRPIAALKALLETIGLSLETTDETDEVTFTDD